MRKITNRRTCVLCKTQKRTTNNQSPYIGTECLRSDRARELLLKDKITSGKEEEDEGWKYFAGGVVIVLALVIGIAIGGFLF